MSRIEDALRRANRSADADRPDLAQDDVTQLPAEDVFQGPWEVEAQAPSADAQSRRPRQAAAGPASLSPVASGSPESAGGSQMVPPPDSRPLAIFQGFSGPVVERLALPSNRNSALIEQFRKLAATLHHSQTAKGIRTVMVTSAIAGEGKTLTATNVALTLSESFRRNVLLVDADLRRPSLHEVFQVPNVAGLTDGLEAPSEGKLPLLQISPLLSLLPAGRPNPDPMHGLISPRMKRIVEEAAANFDWVVIDTPPVGVLTDANLLAAMVDAVLMVVRAGVTPYEFVDRAVEAVGRERVLGVVLNAAKQPVHEDGYGYGYRYGYGHSGDRARK